MAFQMKRRGLPFQPVTRAGPWHPTDTIHPAMPNAVASLIVGLVTTYTAAGMLVATVFVIRGIQVVDPMARGASLGVRLLVWPGAVAFWPLLLVRWAAGSMAPPVETTAHRRAARRAP
jgi:hypothetical protein